MENKCIYCGKDHELSRSDIIPDALTNAKIINPNVCMKEHNNKFSDLFESEVIGKLAIITNELDIKSSKGKKYASYSTRINIEGVEYSTKISSETELFRNKMMRSTDGKYLLGPIELIKKIKKANDENVKQIDVNSQELEQRVKIDLSVFFSESMYRMIAKIAFEWYCLHNDINDKIQDFDTIIQFITKGSGESIVTIVGNEEVYNNIKLNANFGSHTLISYVGQDNSINILVSLFGIVIYNVKICDSLIKECQNNVVFQELTLDAKRFQFKYDTLQNFIYKFYNKFNEFILPDGTRVMLPKNKTDLTLQYQLMYMNSHHLFQGELQNCDQPNEKLVKIITKQLEDTLQASALTLRGLKRFVREYFSSFEVELQLNPNATNKKEIFMFYILFVIGQSNGEIKDFTELSKTLKEKLPIEANEISINVELSSKLYDVILTTEEYSKIILNGAKAVNDWVYN